MPDRTLYVKFQQGLISHFLSISGLEQSTYHNMDDQSWRNSDTSLGLSDNSLNQSHLSMLNSVISCNEGLSKELAEKSQKISELEAKVRQLETENRELLKENQLRSAKRCNSKVPQNLSASVKLIYPKLDNKFRSNEDYRSDYNRNIKNVLHEKLKELHRDATDSELNIAIRSRYSLEKKTFKESINVERDFSQERRRRTRRSENYLARVKVARRTGLHVDVITKMSPADMSDYDSDDENNLIQHRPRWRTNPETTALSEIDDNRNLARKRILGSPSKRVLSSRNP